MVFPVAFPEAFPEEFPLFLHNGAAKAKQKVNDSWKCTDSSIINRQRTFVELEPELLDIVSVFFIIFWRCINKANNITYDLESERLRECFG